VAPRLIDLDNTCVICFIIGAFTDSSNVPLHFFIFYNFIVVKSGKAKKAEGLL
jgi:hypothetical protein